MTSFDMVSMAFPGNARRSEMYGTAHLLSPLALAYVGDTLYDLYVRTYFVCRNTHTPNDLHRLSAKYVCAEGQARAFRCIESELSPEEQSVFRRGRNAHSGSIPKNASIADYHTATGLESLIGYLWINGHDERVSALMACILEEES